MAVDLVEQIQMFERLLEGPKGTLNSPKPLMWKLRDVVVSCTGQAQAVNHPEYIWQARGMTQVNASEEKRSRR